MSNLHLHLSRHLGHRVTALLTMGLLAGSLQAQTTPDAGSLLREVERQPRELPTPTAPLPQPVATPPTEDVVRVFAKAFEFSGNQLLTPAELQQVVSPWLNKELSFSDLQRVADAVAQAYRSRGWLISTKLPAQDVSDGTIRLQILESRLGQFRIDDDDKALRIRPDVLMGALTVRQRPGDPLNLDVLERSSTILNDLPGVGVSILLTAGQEDSTSDVIVKVQDKPLWNGSLQYDNFGSRSTGDNRLGLNASINNPGGTGDQIGLSASASEGSNYLRVGYTLPMGYDGWRAGVNASTLNYKLIGADFEALKAQGDAQTKGLQLSYPWVRTALHNVAFSANYDWKAYSNEMNALPSSHKRIHLGTLSLNGDHADVWAQGGVTLWGASLTAGQLDLSGNANNQNADQSGPRTEGHFEKFSVNIARLQRLSPSLSLWASVTAQRAGKNLDSSEKMSLGGPTGVRAYPVMEAVGDEGVLSTLELRYNLTAQWQLTAFYDHGRIHRDHDASYPGALELQNIALAGRGLGVSWRNGDQWSVRAALAHRSGDNPLANPQNGKDQDGSLNQNRLWLNVVYNF